MGGRGGGERERNEEFTNKRHKIQNQHSYKYQQTQNNFASKCVHEIGILYAVFVFPMGKW